MTCPALTRFAPSAAPSKADVNRWPRDHQPKYCKNGRESRKAKGEPQPEQPVITGGERCASANRLAGEVAHVHLHPDDRQPKYASHEIKEDRHDDPTFPWR